MIDFGTKKIHISPLVIKGDDEEQVSNFHLLVVHIEGGLSWSVSSWEVLKKAQLWLHFYMVLQRVHTNILSMCEVQPHSSPEKRPQRKDPRGMTPEERPQRNDPRGSFTQPRRSQVPPSPHSATWAIATIWGVRKAAAVGKPTVTVEAALWTGPADRCRHQVTVLSFTPNIYHKLSLSGLWSVCVCVRSGLICETAAPSKSKQPKRQKECRARRGWENPNFNTKQFHHTCWKQDFHSADPSNKFWFVCAVVSLRMWIDRNNLGLRAADAEALTY